MLARPRAHLGLALEHTTPPGAWGAWTRVEAVGVLTWCWKKVVPRGLIPWGQQQVFT